MVVSGLEVPGGAVWVILVKLLGGLDGSDWGDRNNLASRSSKEQEAKVNCDQTRGAGTTSVSFQQARQAAKQPSGTPDQQGR